MSQKSHVLIVVVPTALLFLLFCTFTTDAASRFRREMEVVYERNVSCIGRTAEVDRPLNLRPLPVGNKGCKCIEDGWMRCIRKKEARTFTGSMTSRPWVLAEDDWRH